MSSLFPPKAGEDLRHQKDWYESASEISGYIVFFGLVLEAAYVVIFREQRPLAEILLMLFSDVLVALGVFFEVRFGNAASSRSLALEKIAEQQVAEANMRAAEALERAEEERRARIEFETQASRRAITKSQYLELQTLKGLGEHIELLCSNDFESKRFAMQIVKTLWHADISSNLSGMRLTDGFGAGGIVSVRGENVEEDPVYAAFKRAGFNFSGTQREKLHFTFLPPSMRVICILENPATAKDWPPDNWRT